MNTISSYKPVQYSPQFKAIPRACYSTGRKNYIDIYQLEKNDLPFIKKFSQNINKFFEDKQIVEESKREILTNAMDTAQKVLSKDSTGKSKILLGVNNHGELCGMLVGNVAKVDKNGKIHYSSRKNHSRHETELDWPVALNTKGSGKSLVAEYFRTLKQDRFKKVFVRSEVPEETFAQAFYEKLGFKKLYSEREKIAKSSNNEYSIGEYYFGDEEIIPMIARKGKINQTVNNISKLFDRKSLYDISIDIEKIIK